MGHIADDSLSAVVHRDVLHYNFLLAGTAVTLECFDLRRKGPRQFVQRSLGAVLLGNIFDMGQAPDKRHIYMLRNQARTVAGRDFSINSLITLSIFFSATMNLSSCNG